MWQSRLVSHQPVSTCEDTQWGETLNTRTVGSLRSPLIPCKCEQILDRNLMSGKNVGKSSDVAHHMFCTCKLRAGQDLLIINMILWIRANDHEKRKVHDVWRQNEEVIAQVFCTIRRQPAAPGVVLGLEGRLQSERDPSSRLEARCMDSCTCGVPRHGLWGWDRNQQSNILRGM
ncbi:hypothetical protein QTO34_015676 [Cnephaeus nilssonii]|uniref:Uncharacterized protein n=1 Tax=Cnephaeus nilssonii TaxID=3371016 RepID=A0AA40I4J4_CNENI|nr:hypothetical protein QTO34_015676 [Eptesicus nilssonii]